ncbi:hypothetical protein [Salibacter halophilus]|uniref:Uncharacterized protein n=1 Tax=Salibacter halophilus TaxID=1803916 RepID=A0A6N6M9M1_9FLAO|nr:hypothetical protein [Salibacter halophilus]KAB1065912.1 hypothetical protein F3059_00115 [Salibacter halophilus]
MYRDLYDDKHKIRVFSPHERAKGEGYTKKPSTGEYEGGILCADCDNTLLGSKYEDYARKAIYGGRLPENENPVCENFKNQHGVHFTTCQNISYLKFKIFLLSILWRSSISSRPFFSDIKLGPHEEIIRKMIYDGNPGEVDDYPIFFMTYVNDKSMPKDLIVHPRQIRTKSGHRANVFIIGGMVYMFHVNSKNHKLPEHVLTETIKPNNSMNIIQIPKGTGWDVILGYYGLK